MIAAYRGDVVVRGRAGSFTVPEGSYALAAAAAPPQAEADKDDDDDKAGGAVKGKPRAAGRAAGAGAKSGGWSIGNLGTGASIAVVTGATAAAITGAVIAFDDDPASPRD